ncbi:MAG: ABC transporter substrate-binding protein [Verrucomicrobia bacterium]|nr:ABC transporter substrate-binding protein [Verrucomicrobiota bacterium]
MAVTLAGCSREQARTPPQPAGPVKVTVQLDDVPRAELAGFYQALAKGYYQRAGLDVELRATGPETDVAALVANGEADFGVGRSDDIMVRASMGLPLQMVAASRQHDPLSLLVHAKNPVRKLSDLKSHTVLAKAGQAWIGWVQKRQRVTFELKPPGAGLAAFWAGTDAIQAGYVTSDGAKSQGPRAELRAIALSDESYDAYHAIFCRGDFALRNPPVVKAFLQATLLGWSDFLENDPMPAFELMQKRNPALTLAELDYARGELIIGPWIRGDAAKGEYLGDLSRERLGMELDVLLELGVITDPISLNAVATRDYLTRVTP